MPGPDYGELWRWVRERESIRQLKDAGVRPPWTRDEVLRQFRFCNVRREDDRVTRWVRDNVRVPFAGHPNLWLMLCIARTINWPETLAALISAARESTDYVPWPVDDRFSTGALMQALGVRAASGFKVYTGAYTISAPPQKGASKHAYVASRVVGDLWRDRATFADGDLWGRGLRAVHAEIGRHCGWGDFMAYQAVVDMRFTRLLERAPDVATWAAAGPGTLRGLNRVHGRPVDARLTQAQALDEVLAIYAVAERETGVAVDLSDVPNILCEVDKYLRVKLGQGSPRARYVFGRGH